VRRVVFDANVLIAAPISDRGAPAALIVAVAAPPPSAGRFTSAPDRARARREPAKFDRYATPDEKREFVEAGRLLGHHAEDPPVSRSASPPIPRTTT